MHVLVTTDTLGGVWTYTRELVTGLLKHDVRVTLVSFGNIPGEAQCSWMDEKPGLDFRPTAFRLEWMQESGADLAASSEFLMAVISETKPDLLHFNQYFYGALGTHLPKVVVAHSDVVGWYQAVHGTAKESAWLRRYVQLVSNGLRGADIIVAPSAWMLQSLQSNYHFETPTRVIHNGRSPGLFNPYVRKDDYIASVGRVWDLGKNAALLTQIELPALLHLAGENHNPETEEKAIAAVDRHLVIRGVLDEKEMQHLLSRAAIYVATSQYEPFGLASLEAALSRCAILASDIPSFRELWGDTVRYFVSNDAASLQHELKQLHSNRELRLGYGKASYEQALRHYRAEQMVGGYLQLYNSLVPRQASAA
jgi:glycogen(starch) synthase